MSCDPKEDFKKFTVDPEYYLGHGNSLEGPDGLRDYRPHFIDDSKAIGAGDVSGEQTLDTAYLLRAAPGATLERPRSCRPGEVGWGIPWLVDWSVPNTGQQITMGNFRQIAEDRSTHSLMGAWYPDSREQTPLGSDGYYRENIYSGRPGTVNVRAIDAVQPCPPRECEEVTKLEDPCEYGDVTRRVQPNFRPFSITQHHDKTQAP